MALVRRKICEPIIKKPGRKEHSNISNGKREREREKKVSKNEPEDMMSMKENSQECMFCMLRTLNLRMISHSMVCMCMVRMVFHVYMS